MDLIIFKDSLYHLISIDLKEVIDCFDYCNVIREKLTTYLGHINKYVLKDGGGFFYGCICN
jgi:hypothetical protein